MSLVKLYRSGPVRYKRHSLSRQAAFTTSFHDSVKLPCHTQLCCDDGPEAAEAGCQFVDNVDYVVPISRVDLYNFVSDIAIFVLKRELNSN